ncbi:hypothetical protein L6164_027687 [Bauhinia variegata]|nr:hypothetical protein L6164_027687 [Bauhinia variegata]
MDMHIHMSYCSYDGFKLLASNYLGISSEEHHLFGEIEGLIEDTQVTPAQVAEEMMKSENPDAALEGFVNLLKRKKLEGDVSENDAPIKPDFQQPKRRKVCRRQKKTVGISTRLSTSSKRRTRRGNSL